MKLLTVFAALILVALMLSTYSSAFAVSPTWTALGLTGNTITDVQVTKGASTYDITMNLSSAATAGNTYSVYLSPTSDVFDDYSQDVSATTIKNTRTSLSAIFGLTNWEYTDDSWQLGDTKKISGNLSPDKKVLSWHVEQSDLLFKDFWFAGQVTNSATGDSLGTTTVSATPIPGAAWLLGSGILGLVGLKRRKPCAPAKEGTGISKRTSAALAI